MILYTYICIGKSSIYMYVGKRRRFSQTHTKRRGSAIIYNLSEIQLAALSTSFEDSGVGVEDRGTVVVDNSRVITDCSSDVDHKEIPAETSRDNAINCNMEETTSKFWAL